ncbi:MAG: hypothetical protein FD123_3860 [Bacteroidetes bacterium]|nr:MAG: hypothetical protein FD123_3860 [Bacteroidota bacterium]
MKNASLLAIALTLIFLSSCKKGPGEGGNSSVKGQIWVRDYNQNFTVLNGEYAGYDEEVFIIYGDEVNYGDRIKTNYNGEFEFKYLRPGSYKVYVYSKDSTMQSPSGDITIVQDLEITDKKQTVEIPKITIVK